MSQKGALCQGGQRRAIWRSDLGRNSDGRCTVDLLHCRVHLHYHQQVIFHIPAKTSVTPNLIQSPYIRTCPPHLVSGCRGVQKEDLVCRSVVSMVERRGRGIRKVMYVSCAGSLEAPDLQSGQFSVQAEGDLLNRLFKEISPRDQWMWWNVTL